MTPSPFAFRLVLQLLVAIVVTTTGVASAPFPETEPGERLRDLVEALRTDDPSRRSQLLSSNLSREFLEAIPLEHHVAFFEGLGRELGDFEVLAVGESSPDQLVLDVQPEGDAAPRRFLVEFVPQPPHGLIGWMPMAFVDLDALDPNDPMALDRGLRKLAAEGEFSGVVRLERDGRVVFERAYGFADRQQRVPNTVDTLFHLASITKLMTRVAVLQLVQDGTLDLQAPVGALLPELRDELHPITPWQLLRHESGLTEYWDEPLWRERRFRTDRLEAMIDVIDRLPLAFAPGTERRYSNAGYVLLGLVMERVTERPWTEVVRHRIFEPLGMLDSDFLQPSRVTERRFALGYTNLSPAGPEQGYRRSNVFSFGLSGDPSGGAWATSADLARFDDGLRSNALLDAAHRRLLAHLDDADSEEAARAGEPHPNRQVAAAGGAPGVSTLLVSDPVSGRRVIVLSNLDERLGEEIGIHLYRGLAPSR